MKHKFELFVSCKQNTLESRSLIQEILNAPLIQGTLSLRVLQSLLISKDFWQILSRDEKCDRLHIGIKRP